MPHDDLTRTIICRRAAKSFVPRISHLHDKLPSFNAMSFFSEKAKSSTHRGAKGRSKGSSKSKSSSKSREQSEDWWGDWEWNPAWQREYRCRETRSGKFCASLWREERIFRN